MKKILLLLTITLVSIYVSSAQVHEFAITHEARFKLDLKTKEITETIYGETPVNYTLSLDLNNNYLKIVGKDKDEDLKVTKLEEQPDGSIIGFGIDVNRPSQTVVIIITKGEISVIYLQLGIMNSYRTRNK